MLENFLKKIVEYLDPKLDKYRKKAPKFSPKTFEEFVDVLRRTPKEVLSESDRGKIAAIMSFSDRTVKDLMITKKDMVFVNEKDFLGPLTLDRLYKSGFVCFPVVDNNNHVKGIIHTESLNALEIKKTDRAAKYMSNNIYYLKPTNSLEFAISEFKRTGSIYFLVLDEKEELVGFLTIERILQYLLGE